MKKVIKKIIFVLIMLVPINIYAACDYNEIVKLNELASLVDFEYTYDEAKKNFTVTLYNVDSDIKLQINGLDLPTKNKTVTVKGLEAGISERVFVLANKATGCNNDSNLRMIIVNIPYPNSFYNHPACKGYESLAICKSKFTGYLVTDTIFNNAIENYKTQIKNNKNKNVDSGFELPKEEVTPWYTDTFNLLKEYYIHIIISIVSTSLSVIIFNKVLMRIKHGI